MSSSFCFSNYFIRLVASIYFIQLVISSCKNRAKKIIVLKTLVQCACCCRLLSKLQITIIITSFITEILSHTQVQANF